METRPAQRTGPLSGRQVAHYRISEVIGAGGMGEVYRASDERLRREVAIKALPERLSGDEQARRRFIRETRVASRVTHPYVATVFDVIESDGSLLLVMEHIEGQTLNALLRERELDRETVTRYALEISEALQAIHRNGLVHRDLKPGNVMITPDDHVKVMDFGLARPLVIEGDHPTETAITGEGSGVGTPLYMSPEQLRGEEVGPGSDLFSLGVVLYETVSGVHPFRRDSAAESTAAILNEPPGGGTEPESLSNSGPLRDVVMQLLEKEVANRYESCDALVADLRSISRPSLHPWAGGATRRRRRVVALALAAVVMVSLAGAMAWVRQPPSWDRPRYAVAVAPFRDQTRMSDGDVKSAMLSDLLAADLESSHLVRAIGPERTSSLVGSLPSDAGADKVARRVLAGASVDYVLLGTLYHENGLYVATLAFEPASGELPRPSTLREENGDLLALIDSLGASLRGSLPEVSRVNAWRDSRAGIEEITAESDEARLHFERGLLAGRDGKLGEAIEQFEAALATEPDFALGHARLARALHAAGYGRRAREAAEKAVRFDPGRDSRAGKRLSLLIRATRARVLERTGESIEVTGELAALFPDESEMLAMHARSLSRAGEFDSSLNLLDRALEADPLDSGLYLSRAGTLRLMRQTDDALQALVKADELYSVVQSEEGQANVAYQRGHILYQQGRLDEARTEYERGLALLPPGTDDWQVSRFLLAVGQVEFTLGNTESARERFDAGATLALAIGNLGSLCHALTAQGGQRRKSGENEEAVRLLSEAVDLARQLENDILLLSPLSNLGGVLLAQGQLEEGGRLLRETSALAERLGNLRKSVLVKLHLSDVEYQRGEFDEAIRSYQSVLQYEDREDLGHLTPWAHLGLAEVLEQRGRIAEALGQAERGLEKGAAGGYVDITGYAHVRRGQLLAMLHRTDEGMQAIAAAEEIGADPDSRLEELLIRCALARAFAHAGAMRWGQVAEEASRVIDNANNDSPALAVPAISLKCMALLETGRTIEAVRECRAAAGEGRAPLSETTRARALLSQALARGGSTDEALEQGSAAFEAAREMDLYLPLARSAAVLLSLPADFGPDRPDDVRAAGIAALDGYVDAVPEEDHEAIRGSPELSWMRSVLEGGGGPKR